MRFLHPSLFFLWAPLVLVPIVLYLLRPRPRTVRTSTLPFFKWLAREHQDAAWMKWLKHLASLLLSALVVLAGAAALGRLVTAPPAESLSTVVVLVDRSASMAARISGGETLLEQGLTAARERLAGLPEATGVVVMAYDRRPEVLLSRSFDRRAVHQALHAISVRPVEGQPGQAIRLAERLAALGTPAAVWHVTDEPGRGASADSDETPTGEEAEPVEPAGTEAARTLDAMPDGVTVESIRVALDWPINAGITAMQLRRQPLQEAKYEAFLQVHAQAQGPVDVELEMKLDGSLVELHRMTLQPGERAKLARPVEAAPDGERIMTLAVSVEGDALPLDDVVHVRIPQLEPVRVLWIGREADPFTELALASLAAEGDVEVLRGGPSAWPPDVTPDVTIFDGWLPDIWPEDGAVIAIDPPGSLGPFHAARLEGGGVILDQVRATDRRHPLLYGVATERIALTQSALVEAAGTLETVWVGPEGPLLLAGETRGRRAVVMAFDPSRSERLPLTSSYPILLGNTIYWSAEGRLETLSGMNRRTGEIIDTKARRIVWRDPETGDDGEEVVELTGGSVELDRIGLWETEEAARGAAALLSERETVLPSGGGDAESVAEAALLPRGDLTPLLIWAIVLVLIVESWLYHRCLIY